jgi:hypothetical protein
VLEVVEVLDVEVARIDVVVTWAIVVGEAVV